MKNNYLKTIGSALIVGAFTLLSFGSGESDSNKNSSSASETNEKVSCAMCGKDLTDDVMGRISPNGSSYYCYTPCYQKFKGEVSDDLEAQGLKRIDN